MKNKSTKNVPTRLAASAAMLMLTVGVFGSSQALAGIASTKHNLGSSQNGNNAFTPTTGTAELCVFCHTPHGADTTAAVPLWNRKLASPATYTTYNSLGTSSLDGATAPVGSVSIACLSCHDGVQAMNTMINQPGSGGYLAAGAAWAGTWSGSRVTLTGVDAGKLLPGIISNIGQDLKNDHPIGIQYGGGMPSGGAYTTGIIADGGFKDPDFKGVQYTDLNSNPVWWVDTAAGAAGTRQKTDMLLYTRSDQVAVNKDGSAGATLTGAQAFVECASCHDPHSENTTFLRIQNTGSAVCLACHTK